VTQRLTGTHHVSMLSADIAATHAFHSRVLGLRPVIKTVNQDDPGMYHLFYGDGAGSPGSDLTFFDMPMATPEKRGNNSISLTTLRVSGDGVFEYWLQRFDEHGVRHSGIATRDGRTALDFEDPQGTQLSLVDDGGDGISFPWDESLVPARYQIRGLGYNVITVPVLEPTDRFLTGALGLVQDHTYPVAGDESYSTYVYRAGKDGVRSELHVEVRDDLPRARYGAGGVHHLALSVPVDNEIDAWARHLDELGYRNSGVVDRHYFKSVYVREPNHVLFELATDGPGIDVDGPIDGDRLVLPPFLEPQRAQIEANLAPLP
jgi:glyoxalase family protein